MAPGSSRRRPSTSESEFDISARRLGELGDALEGLAHAGLGLVRDPSVFEHPALTVLRDIPALAHEGASLHRLELVAPDTSGRDAAEDAGRAGLPGDAAVR